MKEIDASIDRGEGGEEKEKERKEKESVYTEIFSILNKNGLGKGKTDLKTIGLWNGSGLVFDESGHIQFIGKTKDGSFSKQDGIVL